MSSSSTSKPSAGTSMGTLDPAIFTRILALLAPKKYAPHKRLAPLLRVNKHWHLHALPRLYSAISLKGQWVARPLRRTLESNAALAALVQELVLDTELSAQAPAETADHRRIVAACPNLKHLTVLGYAEAEAEKYREAIAGRAQLETLNVSEGGGLCTFADLLGMMRGWPMLEKLILKDALLPARSDSDPESNSASEAEETAASCPALKMVKITDTLDASKHFSFASFAALAPAVSVLWVQPGPQLAMPADLVEGLRVWAPSLEALCLLSDTELPVTPTAPLPPFPALHHLGTTSQLLPPRFIAVAPGAGTLTALTYRVFPAQLLDLAEALSSPNVLPSLRAVEVKSWSAGEGRERVGFTGTAERAMRSVCKRRRVKLTI